MWLWAAGSSSLGGPWAPFTLPNPEKLKYLQRANTMLKYQRAGKDVSRFIVVFEDPVDSSMWNKLPRIGWHKAWNRHSVMFLDGHSGNIRMDPTKGNYGQGWKTMSHNWYADPNDPDYALKDLK